MLFGAERVEIMIKKRIMRLSLMVHLKEMKSYLFEIKVYLFEAGGLLW